MKQTYSPGANTGTKFWFIWADLKVALLGGEQASTWLVGHSNCQNASVSGSVLTSPLVRSLQKCYKRRVWLIPELWCQKEEKKRIKKKEEDDEQKNWPNRRISSDKYAADCKGALQVRFKWLLYHGTGRSPQSDLQMTQGVVWLSLLTVLLAMHPSRSGAGHRLSCSQLFQKLLHPSYFGSDSGTSSEWRTPGTSSLKPPENPIGRMITKNGRWSEDNPKPWHFFGCFFLLSLLEIRAASK